jgi:hypothetical protein
MLPHEAIQCAKLDHSGLALGIYEASVAAPTQLCPMCFSTRFKVPNGPLGHRRQQLHSLIG